MIKSNISDVAVDKVGMDVRVKFGDSMCKSDRIIQFCRPHPFWALLCSIELNFAADRKQLVEAVRLSGLDKLAAIADGG